MIEIDKIMCLKSVKKLTNQNPHFFCGNSSISGYDLKVIDFEKQEVLLLISPLPTKSSLKFATVCVVPNANRTNSISIIANQCFSSPRAQQNVLKNDFHRGKSRCIITKMMEKLFVTKFKWV